jgi:NADPH-dependent 2,4-dienoyl-CoA reductase/sulfur reductase-like enzyme
VIEAGPVPLERQLGSGLASSLLKRHQDLGVRFLLDDHVTAVHDDWTAVRLGTAGGHEIAADLVVEAVGSRPATDWVSAGIADAGLALDDGGLVCDETCAVIGAPDVVAAGDVAVWLNPPYRRRMRVEHWTNAMEQAEYAAASLLGVHDPAGYRGLPYFWSTQGTVKLQALGSTWGHDEARVIRDDESSALVEYRAAGRLIAIAGIGAGRDVMRSRGALLESLQSA